MIKKYQIECLQGAPFDSWIDEEYTEDEIKDKFWSYARDDGSLDDIGGKPHWFTDDGELIEEPPEDFTLDLIKCGWQIDLHEVKE